MNKWSENGDIYDMEKEQPHTSWWGNLHWLWKLVIFATVLRGILYLISYIAGN